MVPEASSQRTAEGVVPEGEGWFVVNATEARWFEGDFGAFTRFEGATSRFDALGINIGVLAPGQPACVIYPASDLAQRHGAGVDKETSEPKEAYAGLAEDMPVPYCEGWLPG